MEDFLLSIKLKQRFSIMLSITFIVIYLTTVPALSVNSSFNNPTLKEQGFVMNLINRELIYPTKYPSGSTFLDRIDLALSRVASRSSLHNNVHAVGKIETGGGSFFAKIYIGSSLLQQYVAFDTGGLFLWVQCKGYDKGHETGNQAYDPLSSRSYKPATCLAAGDWYCKKVPGGGCDENKRCKYSIGFKDDSHSIGHLGFETITFDRDRPTSSQVHNVLFGCGIDNHDTNKYHKDDGVFGIGPLLELSILRMTKKKFSFCYGSISDQNYKYNHLALGDNAKLLGGHPVQFTIDGYKYHVKLTGITVGKHKIKPPRNLKMMIDTGTTLSYVQEDIQLLIIHLVEDEMRNRIEKIQVRSMPDALCYRGSAIPKPFAQMNLVLGPHTTIQLDADAMFWKIPQSNVFCMIFLKATHPKDNIIGAAAMQHHNVGFDLNTNLVYFKKTDCASPR